MPTFAQPLILLLLLLVPILLVRWRRQGKGSLRFSSVTFWQGLPAGRVRWAQNGGLVLRCLGLVFLVVALAGPRWPDPGSRLPTEGIALAMVVDVSRSMDNRDFLWDTQLLTRLEGVKKVFRLFVEGGRGPDGTLFAGRPQDLISLVTFATRPETACPLTLDHHALVNILEKLEPRTLLTEATSNPGDGLAWALASLNKASAKRKVIVFLTDGESNVPPPVLKPRQAAQLAGNLGIPIYAIDANADVPPEDSQAQEDFHQAQKTLQDIAGMTGGRYFRATSAGTLTEVYAQIDRLERSRIESFQYRFYHEGFVWFGLASLATWLALVVLEATVWRKLP